LLSGPEGPRLRDLFSNLLSGPEGPRLPDS